MQDDKTKETAEKLQKAAEKPLPEHVKAAVKEKQAQLNKPVNK